MGEAEFDGKEIEFYESEATLILKFKRFLDM